LRDRLLRACDPGDAGIETLRRQLENTGPSAATRRNEKEADAALQQFEDVCPGFLS
jgi:hypothetical protein